MTQATNEQIQAALKHAEIEYNAIKCVMDEVSHKSPVIYENGMQLMRIWETIRSCLNDALLRCPFNENNLVIKALDMYGMIDTEQMYRTIKAMRELNMSPYPAAVPAVQENA
jgi:hypothetical protein